MRRILTPFIVTALAVSAGACSSDDDAATTVSAGSGSSRDPVPQIVVTTNILGDIVSKVVGDLAEVEVIMPIGSAPHDFAPSVQQAAAMENADLLVINGAGFEEGMVDIIANVEDSGTAVFAFADQIELVEISGQGADDPHIWTDPTRMITAVAALGDELAGLVGIDAEAVEWRVDAYTVELNALYNEMNDVLSSIPDDQRVLVTNHEVFGYFADRFGFEVVGAVIPSSTTNAAASASDIEELASLIDAEGIPAIFGETTQPTQLAEVLAEAVGSEVPVVVLFSESLGEQGTGAETYIGMMSTNAQLIAAALATA